MMSRLILLLLIIVPLSAFPRHTDTPEEQRPREVPPSNAQLKKWLDGLKGDSFPTAKKGLISGLYSRDCERVWEFLRTARAERRLPGEQQTIDDILKEAGLDFEPGDITGIAWKAIQFIEKKFEHPGKIPATFEETIRKIDLSLLRKRAEIVKVVKEAFKGKPSPDQKRKWNTQVIKLLKESGIRINGTRVIPTDLLMGLEKTDNTAEIHGVRGVLRFSIDGANNHGVFAEFMPFREPIQATVALHSFLTRAQLCHLGLPGESELHIKGENATEIRFPMEPNAAGKFDPIEYNAASTPYFKHEIFEAFTKLLPFMKKPYSQITHENLAAEMDNQAGGAITGRGRITLPIKRASELAARLTDH